MVKVCLADSHPVVHFGVKSYFRDHDSISIVANVGNFMMVKDILQTKEIDVLLLDLELEGLSSIFEVKNILKNFPKTKIIIFSDISEQIYAPNAIKAGVSGFVSKKEKLETLGQSIVKVNQGSIIINENVKKNMALIAKQNKSGRYDINSSSTSMNYHSCVQLSLHRHDDKQTSRLSVLRLARASAQVSSNQPTRQMSSLTPRSKSSSKSNNCCRTNGSSSSRSISSNSNK
jgi:DNA-binding NarL/FixJ family response regulator